MCTLNTYRTTLYSLIPIANFVCCEIKLKCLWAIESESQLSVVVKHKRAHRPTFGPHHEWTRIKNRRYFFLFWTTCHQILSKIQFCFGNALECLVLFIVAHFYLVLSLYLYLYIALSLNPFLVRMPTNAPPLLQMLCCPHGKLIRMYCVVVNLLLCHEPFLSLVWFFENASFMLE